MFYLCIYISRKEAVFVDIKRYFSNIYIIYPLTQRNLLGSFKKFENSLFILSIFRFSSGIKKVMDQNPVFKCEM